MSNEPNKTETKSITTAQRVVPLAPQSLNDVYDLAKQLAASKIIPENYQGNVPNIVAAAMMGNDLGISTMQAMREIYVVHGRPASSALLKVALVRQSPLCRYWRMVESTDKQAIFETLRDGDPAPTRHSYTLEDAKRAGLFPGKPDRNGEPSQWSKRTALMLRRRCESELADEVYPDVVKGLRTEDEAAEMVRDMGTLQRVDLSSVQPISASLPAATRIPEVVEPTAEPVKVETQPAADAKKGRIIDESTTPDPAPAAWTDEDEDKLSQWENSEGPVPESVYLAMAAVVQRLPKDATRTKLGDRVRALKPRVVKQSAEAQREPGAEG